MKRIFLIIFFAILISVPFLSLAAGLVPCGGCIEYNTDRTCKTSEPACQLCHFFVLFKNVVNFLLKYILSPLAIIMLMIGGFMYVFAYLNPSEALFGRKGGPALISQAKKLIISVVVGIIVLFLAWGIVNVIFQMLGVAEWTGLKAGNWWNGNWWDVNKDCPTEASPISPCTPATCQSLLKQCGVWYDNCDKYLSCDGCGSNEVCNTFGQCVSVSQPQPEPPTSTPPVIPPNAQPLNLDFRYPGFNFQPGETYFVISVTNPNIKSIRGQILGLTGETDVTGTWFFSDSVSFHGYAFGTDNASMLDIRSLHAVQPNLNYDYIPVGNYLFKIKANAPSSVIIWFTTYE